MSIDCDMTDFFNLVKNFTKSITFCGNPYIRKKIYEYCENNNLKFVKHRVKVLQYICGEHNCHLKFSSNRTGSWRWDTYCPIYEDDGCGPHYEVKNRENVITIYKDKPNYKDIIYYIMN